MKVELDFREIKPMIKPQGISARAHCSGVPIRALSATHYKTINDYSNFPDHPPLSGSDKWTQRQSTVPVSHALEAGSSTGRSMSRTKVA